MNDLLVLAEADGVATLLLNRSAKLNAFNDAMRAELLAALEALAGRSGVRTLVITGAGRGFSAGGDLQFMRELKERGAGYEGLRPLVEAGNEAALRLAALPYPTIAAVNGPAAGGGLNLALACDLVLASDRATFGQTFVRIGLHPDWGATHFLPRRVGPGKALELCWTGEVIEAAEALRIGLVDRVWPHEAFGREVRAFAARLAASPRTSVRLTKRSLYASLSRTLAENLAAESEAQEACWNSPDSTEGVRAFLEKRAPVFERDAAPGGVAAATRFE